MSWNSVQLNMLRLSKTDGLLHNQPFLKVGICSTEQSSSSFLQNVHFRVDCKNPGSETTSTTISEREICQDLNFMEAKNFTKETIQGAKDFIFYAGMSMGRHLLTYD